MINDRNWRIPEVLSALGHFRRSSQSGLCAAGSWRIYEFTA